MIKLDKRQIISLFILFFYTIETAYPQSSTLAPPSAFEKTDPEEELWRETVTLASSREWKDQERSLGLLSRDWGNPSRRLQAIKLLVSALKWTGRLREIAKENLIKIGRPAVPEILDALYKEDGNGTYVWELVETIGGIKDPSTIDPLIELLQRPGFPKRPVMESLYKIGDPLAVERLLDLVVNKGKQDAYLFETLRWVGRLDLQRMYTAWRHAEPGLKPILFNLILQMSSEISLGLLIIAIRDSDGAVKTELEKKRDLNYYWEERLNTESRGILEQLAYYLYDIDKLHIFSDLVDFLSRIKYIESGHILELLEEARRVDSPEPFLSTFGKPGIKKNTEFYALLLDRLGYYPPDYIAQVLRNKAAHFLQEMGIIEGITYRELISSQLFWHRYWPQSGANVLSELRRTRDFLGPELFRRIIKEQGLHTLTNKVILEEVVEVELDTRLTILVHPDAIPFLTRSIKDARIGRRLFFLGSYTRPAQSGIAQDSFKKFLEWNYNARQAMAKADTIDKIILGQIVDAVEKMFYYYKQSFSDDKLAEIEAKWAGIKAEAFGLVSSSGPLLSSSEEARRITQLTPQRRADSLGDIKTIHDFINFIHQRGINKRFSLSEERIQHGTPGELTTILFTEDGKAVDKAKHSFLIRKGKEGRRIITLPEELRYVLRNLLFFMNDNFSSTECRLDISDTEITVFLPIGVHSARLYINLTQPQQGGMIELEWDEGDTGEEFAFDEGNILRLELLEIILKEIGFSVSIETPLLKARYDSQNGASTIKDIADRAARILRLVTGTRRLDHTLLHTGFHKERYAEAGSFIWQMGMPVFRRMLDEGATEPYLEALNRWEPVVREVVNKYLRDLGLELLPEDIPFGPNMINTYFNKQIDRAVERQELVYDGEGRLVRNPDYTEPSQVYTFAELLQDPSKRKNLITMANLFHEVIKLVPARIVNIGTINGYQVRRIQLEFPGRTISLWGLYHPTGQILASYGAIGDRLNRTVDPRTGEVKDNVITSPEAMLDILRRQKLHLSKHLLGLSPNDLKIRTNRLDKNLARPQFIPLVNLGASVRFAGVKVSKGLATGRAIFNSPAKSPGDFEDAVLVAPFTSPGDEPKMERSEAIVATGGGPRTHTGIIARELRKPSLIISGEWLDVAGEDVLQVPYEIFTPIQEQVGEYSIIRRVNINPKMAVIKEGDILTIDGNSGTLYNWGQGEGILEAWELSKKIQARKDWKAWEKLLELAGNTQDRLVARFLIHKIFAGRLSTIIEQDEKVEFVSRLCSNRSIGSEGEEFLYRLLTAKKGELEALISEYRVRIKNSIYPREILQLVKEVQERYSDLLVFYHVLETNMPSSLPEGKQGLEELANAQYQKLGAKVLGQLENYLKGTFPTKAKEIRHLRNLWDEAEFLSGLTPLNLKKFSRIERRLDDWEKEQGRRVDTLKDKDILPLDQMDIYTMPLTGAKAASLGEIAKLVRKKFVPNGFSITDHAFQRFMAFNNLWKRMEGIMASTNIPERKYELVQEAFTEADWPGDLKEDIFKRYHLLERDMALEEKGEYISELIDKALTDESEDIRSMIKRIFAGDSEKRPNQWQKATISEIINQIELITPGIKEKLLRYNEKQGGPMVAVRSSSIGGEDSPEASFAGELETYLYQRGQVFILNHIKRCMASLWTPRVISYRDWHGFPQTGLHHSVFVQLMVDSEVSAVGFTIDPASGDWNQIVLDAGWGVGEGIMGGKVNTDLYSIDKNASLEDGVVVDVRPKPTMYVLDRETGRGICQADVPAGKIKKATLDLKDIETIKSLLMTLERYWGMPRDVELAKDKAGDIKILQGRPVTALNGVVRRPRIIPEEEILKFGDAIKRFDEISQKNQEFAQQELRLIALVLLRELKPTRIREDRLLDEKAREAVSLIIKFRNTPDLIQALIIEATQIVLGGIRDTELRSMISQLVSQLLLHSDGEGLSDLSTDKIIQQLLTSKPGPIPPAERHESGLAEEAAIDRSV